MEENRLISSSFIHFDTLSLLKAADKAYKSREICETNKPTHSRTHTQKKTERD